MAVVVDKRVLACAKLAEEILSTHTNLTHEEIKLGVNALCQLDLPNDKLAVALLLLNRSSMVGRSARLYNDKIDSLLKQGSKAAILSGIAFDISAFEEYQNSTELTSQERQILSKEIDREYNAVYMALTSNIDGDNFLPCETEQLSIDGTSIYTKCYRNVCVAESTKEGKTPACGLLKGSSLPCTSYEIIDKPISSSIPHVYCLEFDEILASLSTSPPLNPVTGNPWSIQALNGLNQRFAKDLKLYRYYLTHK